MKRHVVLSLLMALITLTYSMPSAACQLVCMRTKAKYDGRLTGMFEGTNYTDGWLGGDARCRKEYPNFKMARSGDMRGNTAGGMTLEGWGAGALAGCGNWNSSNGSTQYSYTVEVQCADYNQPAYYDENSNWFPSQTLNTCGINGSSGIARKQLSAPCSTQMPIIC